MPHLFEPLTLRGVTLRNRIGVSPMCQYSAEGGMANDWHLAHLGSFAAGGAGLIIVEATAVEARGRISPYDLGLWKDEQINPLARVARFITSQGAVPGIQIAHAGRKAGTQRPWDGVKPVPPGDSLAWQPVGASPIPFAEGYQTPCELSPAEIQEVVEGFAAAARRAVEAGFTWIEIHGAHGYLIHSFYSPLANHREDAYGGAFDGRARLPLEVAQAVRQACPAEIPVTMRLSCTDWLPNGWQLEDSVALSKRLKALDIDLVDCSSAGNAPRAEIPLGPGYQVPLAEAVRRDACIPTAAVGLITAPAQADEIIRNGRADIALLGREMLRNPHWAQYAARELKQPPPVPSQYVRAW